MTELQDLEHAVAVDDDPDDEVQMLPLRPVLPARPSKCPRGPCLKRSGSGSDFDPLSSPEQSAPNSPFLRASALSMTACESSDALASRRPSFRCFSGSTSAKPQKVRFDETEPEAGLTHSSKQYDRTPIESTQCKGSSLDLSLRRCTTRSGDEGDDEADAADHGDDVPIESPLAAKVIGSGYFGSWTCLKAGSIIGLPKADVPKPATENAASALTQPALPTHSFRCFGGLAETTITADGVDNMLSSPKTGSTAGACSAEATPMQSPSVSRTAQHHASYFEEESQPFTLHASPPSTARPQLHVVTSKAHEESAPGDVHETPTQAHASSLLDEPHPEAEQLSARQLRSQPQPSSSQLTLTALTFESLESSRGGQLKACGAPTSPFRDSESEASTASGTHSLASDESPPLSWLSGSSGCTSPDSLPLPLNAPLAGCSMARSSSADHPDVQRLHITQHDLDSIPHTLLRSTQGSSGVKAQHRLADRFALADESSSGFSSSSPLVSTDEDSRGCRVHASVLASRQNASPSASAVAGRSSIHLAVPSGSSASDSCSGNTTSDENGAAPSSPGVLKRKKKKRRDRQQGSAFRSTSFDDELEGALGGF